MDPDTTDGGWPSPVSTEVIATAATRRSYPTLDGLVGDDPQAWPQRAPIEHVDGITALEVELSPYGQVWGFTPADEVEPVEVHHLG